LNEIPNSWITCPGGEKTRFKSIAEILIGRAKIRAQNSGDSHFFSPVIGENQRGVANYATSAVCFLMQG